MDLEFIGFTRKDQTKKKLCAKKLHQIDLEHKLHPIERFFYPSKRLSLFPYYFNIFWRALVHPPPPFRISQSFFPMPLKKKPLWKALKKIPTPSPLTIPLPTQKIVILNMKQKNPKPSPIFLKLHS